MRSLGQFAYRRRKGLALAGMVLAILSGVGGATVFDNVKPFGFQDPDSESARAYDALERASGQRAIPEVELLVRSKAGGLLGSAESAAARLRGVPGVTRVVGPDADPRLISADRRAAVVLGFISSDVEDISEVGADVRDRFADSPGIETGGAAVTVDELTTTTQDDLRRIELYALPILLVLSLIVFRGLAAAALPVVVGVLSILTTLLLLNALTKVMEIDAFAINIVTGLGLGLAIDYSLFLVTRFREELARARATELAGHRSIEAAVTETMAAIGPMIVFSGLTVGVSLIALCVFPQRFLYSVGIGGALVAASSALVCLLFLPAVLALLGERVNALAPIGVNGPPSEWRWHRLARFVLRHPLAIAAICVGLMVAAGLPFLRVHLTQADAKILPSDASAHRVERAIDKKFAGDPAARVVVVLPNREEAITARRYLARQPAVSEVTSPEHTGPGVFRVDAQLAVGGFSDGAVRVVDRARSQSWAAHALIAGPPAELRDERQSLGDHLPLALVFILLTTGVLLFVMTGSVVMPIVALAMNTLTVSVAFGVLVLVFQDGRMQELLGFTSPGGLDTSMPILLFAVVFGLSTDYGVFLLQRIAEARRHTDIEDVAIAEGVASSGRIISAAALLFAVAMGAFAFSELVYVKEVAVGAAVAVLVDATIVRAFLFPAVLKLLGSAAWWAPPALSRFSRRAQQQLS